MTACPTTRCASGTATGSARRSSRSPSPGSPATGSGCASASRTCPRCWSATTGPASTCACSREGHIEAGDQIVKTRTGPGALSVAATDALLYLPGHDPGTLRRALQIPALSPGWQGSFRDLLAAADSASRSHAARAHRAGLERVPAAAGGPGDPRNHRGDLDLPHRRRRGVAAGRPGRPVPDPADHRRRAARPGAQLLAVLRARCQRLPDQRQARTPRRRQHLPAQQPAARARSSTPPRPAASSSSTTARARCC